MAVQRGSCGQKIRQARADRRPTNMIKDPEDWTTGDEPMTGAQASYLRTLASEAGEEYWVSMNLAGRFASACHHTIHRAIGKRLGERPLLQVRLPS